MIIYNNININNMFYCNNNIRYINESVQINITKWEVRDRLYLLSSDRRPLVFSIPSKHGKRPLLWWDDETGKNRELRYAIHDSDGNELWYYVLHENQLKNK